MELDCKAASGVLLVMTLTQHLEPGRQPARLEAKH